MTKTSTYIPLADLRAQYLSIKPEIDRAIARVLDSGSYVMGSEVEAFEAEWGEYCGSKYCVGVSSGTDALYLSLRALGITDQKIITTPATFFATTQAIIQSGNFPAFIDIDRTDNLPDMNFGSRIALPVDLYGRPGNWQGDYVIVDAAQSHGVPARGRISCYSFYPTKNLGAFGQAGAVVTNDVVIADTIRTLRNYGEGERFVHYATTGNHRIDELQAAVLRAKLPHLTRWNERRRQIAGQYRELLDGLDSIRLPEDHPQHVYHIFAVRAQAREGLIKFLNDQGVQTSVRYPVPLHLQPALKYRGYQRGDFPMAEAWASETLSLAIYETMPSSYVEYVGEKVKEYYANLHHLP